MKQENGQHRDFEELYEELEKIVAEYPEYFKALEALPPTEPPIFIENVPTTSRYEELDSELMNL